MATERASTGEKNKKGKGALPIETDRFRALFDSLADAVIIVTKTGEIIEANEWATKVTGYSYDELVGMNVLTSSLIPIETKALIVKNLAKRFAGMYIEPYEIDVIAKDGSRLPVELNARLIEIDGRPMDLVVFRDVTERRKAREALRESEERFRTIFSNVNDVIIYMDKYGNVLDVSPSVEKQFGYTPDELVGKHFLKLGVLGLKDIPRMARLFKDSIQKGELIERLELDVTAKGGDMVSIEATTKLITKDGSIGGIVAILRNITERREAEAAVRNERDRAQNYLNVASVILVAIDAEGEVTMINRKGCELLGYPEDQIVGKDWFSNFIPKRFRKQVKAVSEKIISGEIEPLCDYENPVHTASGEERLIAWHNTELRNENGDIIGHLSSGEDVTERREAEDALKESEERLRDLFENMTEMVQIVATDGSLLYVNKAWCEILGYTEEEVQGFSIFDIIHTDSKEHCQTIFKDVTSGTPVSNIEATFITKDGKSILVEGSANCRFEDGMPVSTRGIFRDITERREAEEALRESEARFRVLFNSGSDAVFVHGFTEAGKPESFIEVNDVACSRLGYNREEFLSMSPMDIDDPSVPVDMPHLTATLMKKGHVLFEAAHSTKNGTSIPVEISSHLFVLSSKVLVLSVARDITERKQAEEELRQRAAFVMNNPAPVLQAGPDGTILTCNKPAELLTRSDVVGTKIHKSLPTLTKTTLGKLKPDALFQFEERLGLQDYLFTVIKHKQSGSYFIYGLDITDRKEAELALKDSKEKLQAIIENASDIIYSIDLEGILTFVTPNVADLGFEQEDVVGHSLAEFIHKDDIARVLEDMKRSLTTGEEFPTIMRLMRKDSSFIHAEESGRVIKEDGKPVGITGVIRDVTERKEAEDQLRKLARAVEQSPTSVVITAPDGTIEYVNPAFTKVTGYSTKKAVGSNPRVLKSGEHPKEFYKDLWATITAGRTWHGEFRNKKKNGELYWETASISPVLNEEGETTHFVAVKEDITERKRMEEELHEHRKHLEDLVAARTLELSQSYEVQNLLNALLQVTVEDVPLDTMLERFLNRLLDIPWLPEKPHGSIHLLGDEPDTLVLKAQEGMPKAQLEQCRKIRVGQCACGRAVASRKTMFMDYSDERHEIKIDGLPLHTVYCVPVRSGKTVHGVIKLRLEKDHVRSEKEDLLLSTAADILNGAIERKRAEETIMRSLAEKELLLKEIHHRVKNNLQVISSLLNLQSGKLTDDTARDMFRISQGRVKSMALIHESLYRAGDLASIDFGVYAQRLVNDLVRNYRVGTGVAQLKVDVADVHLGIDKAVPCGLIINELVTNALKYAFPEGRKGTITVSMEKGKKDTLVLTVADDGAGIPKDFDLTQSDSLGMQLVNTLTGQLDGKLDLDRKKGTRFRITFPFKRGALGEKDKG